MKKSKKVSLKKSTKKEKKTRKKTNALNKIKKSSFYVPDDLRLLIGNDAKKFLFILGFNNYRIQIFYKTKPIEYENDELTREGMVGMVTASSHIDTRYLRVDINIYPPFVERWNNKKLDTEEVHTIIAHEIAHLATYHLYKSAISVFKSEEETIDNWESLTSLIGGLLNKIDRLQKTNTKLDK